MKMRKTEELSEYFGAPKDVVLTLDQVMACEVESYDRQAKELQDILNSVVANRDIKNSSTEHTVLPKINDFYSWFQAFPTSMREPRMRLQGTLWTRTCFVENGMKITLALGDAISKELTFLEEYKQKCTRFIELEQSGEGERVEKKRARPIEGESSEAAIVATAELDRAGRVIKVLASLWKKVMGPEKEGLFLMYSWFNALVDLIPDIYKSHNSVLTRKNVTTLADYQEKKEQSIFTM